MKESKVIIHGTGSGTCALTGKDGDGLTVSFDDGTVREAFLSWKGFRQLLGMKSTQGAQSNAHPAKQIPTANAVSAIN